MGAGLSGKVSKQVELDCPAEKMFKGILHSYKYHKEIFYPHSFESMELAAGDGESVGSVKKLVRAGVTPVKLLLQKITSIDLANHNYTYDSVDGGDVPKFFKKFIVTIEVGGNGEDGCITTWSLDYTKKNIFIPSPDNLAAAAAKELKILADHLAKI